MPTEASTHRVQLRLLCEYNTFNSDIISEPINSIPHKKFSEASGYNATVSGRRSEARCFAGSRTFHIFYVKRIWALLWDALLGARRVNT